VAISVVLDACVLVPHPLFDTLLRVAEAGLYRPLWSAQILTEVERTLIIKRGLGSDKAARRIEQMQRAFPGAMVEDFDQLIPAMTNDPKDRHVLAAAVRAGAGFIVTANLKDFPERALSPVGVEALHPDAFLLDQLDLAPERVLACLRDQRAAYRNPARSVLEFYETFVATVPEFAQAAESLERGPSREALSAPDRPEPTQLPLPIETRPDVDAAAAFFPDGDPDPTTPLGAAFLWWAALLDLENLRTAIENLTWHPPSWNGFAEARAELEGWAMAQNVHPNEERPDQIAYVKLIPDSGMSGVAFASAPLYDVQILTLVRCADGWWRVWGLSRNHKPSMDEIPID
jgi:predicted nucleic acid-binding protein